MRATWAYCFRTYCDELEAAMATFLPDPEFQAELKDLLCNYAGRETPLKILLVNNGTSTARAIELSASGTTGWIIEFEPKIVNELPANQQIEVTAKVRPSDKAVAGDYMLTMRAQPAEGPAQSTEFRITVLTSTLWGVVGIVLIAIAVGVVALAVFRFGRR
jgi:uncharacterized membrane protein